MTRQLRPWACPGPHPSALWLPLSLPSPCQPFPPPTSHPLPLALACPSEAFPPATRHHLSRTHLVWQLCCRGPILRRVHEAPHALKLEVAAEVHQLAVVGLALACEWRGGSRVRGGSKCGFELLRRFVSVPWCTNNGGARTTVGKGGEGTAGAEGRRRRWFESCAWGLHRQKREGGSHLVMRTAGRGCPCCTNSAPLLTL